MHFKENLIFQIVRWRVVLAEGLFFVTLTDVSTTPVCGEISVSILGGHLHGVRKGYSSSL